MKSSAVLSSLILLVLFPVAALAQDNGLKHRVVELEAAIADLQDQIDNLSQPNGSQSPWAYVVDSTGKKFGVIEGDHGWQRTAANGWFLIAEGGVEFGVEPGRNSMYERGPDYENLDCIGPGYVSFVGPDDGWFRQVYSAKLASGDIAIGDGVTVTRTLRSYMSDGVCINYQLDEFNPYPVRETQGLGRTIIAADEFVPPFEVRFD